MNPAREHASGKSAGEVVRCNRCMKPVEPADTCDKCDHIKRWRCTNCRAVAVNADPHPCEAEARNKKAAKSISAPPAGVEEITEGDGMESPPPETLENARLRVREVFFQPDGTILASRPGLPGEEDLGSAWLMATQALFERGAIDEDTVVSYPGGPEFVTVGTLIREGKLTVRRESPA